MSRHGKKPTPEPGHSLHANAYVWQHGEFHPEHHQANIQALHAKYPGHSLAEIDDVYRQACQIDYEVQQSIGGAQLSPGAKSGTFGLAGSRIPRVQPRNVPACS